MGAYSRMYFLFTSRWAYIFFLGGGGEGLISWKVHSVRYLYSIKRVPLTPYIYLNIVPWTVRLGREKKHQYQYLVITFLHRLVQLSKFPISAVN